MTDIETFAAELNGCEYISEGTKELWARMASAGCVAVFGASDDLMEFRGAINDEVGCYDGGTAYVTSNGLFETECDNDDCPHEKRFKSLCATIEAVWCETEEYSWTYETSIPHASFDVMEDGEKYCRGIVFKLSDVN